MDSKPPAFRFTKSNAISYKTYQFIVLVVTFFAYLNFHATRKTTSIVKNALDPRSSGAPSGWAPFNGPNGNELLGQLDVAFLFVYALGMYLSGHVGDRMDLRVFLTIGMVGTGVFTGLFGLGYWANIHSYYYYLILQVLAGLFQSTGWPSVIAVMGNWFGRRNRGLVMGIWEANSPLGNVVGTVVGSALLRYGWGWSVVAPCLGMGFAGLVVFALLPVSPAAVGAVSGDGFVASDGDVREAMLEKGLEEKKAVGFWEAWSVDGVAPFALCLFFVKLVGYTFVYWLPFYISHTAIEGRYLTDEESGNLSTLFDIGGVAGGILAGYISDQLGGRAITAASFVYCSIPALFLYRSYGHVSTTTNIALMLITGMFVSGPYALITTAVSADLGTHSSLKGNSRALATVSAIIDGTGSVGAAIGPLLTGYISAKSWDSVFAMLMFAALLAGLLLTRLVVEEVRAKIRSTRQQSPRSRGPPAMDV